MAKFRVGDTAYLIESNYKVREVKVVRCSGGIYLIKFSDTGGGIQVKEHRLYRTREEAEENITHIPKTKEKPFTPRNSRHQNYKENGHIYGF